MSQVYLHQGQTNVMSDDSAQPPSYAVVMAEQQQPNQRALADSQCWIVVGIISAILCCLPLSIAGAILAHRSKLEAQQKNSSQHRKFLCLAKGMVIAAILCGLLGIIAILLRKFVKHVAKQRPTHLDGLDWQYYYRMLSGYIPGGVGLRAILSALLRRYKINTGELGLADAASLLSQRMKRVKKLGFQSIWAEIQVDKVKLTRIPEYHWALTPDLAHYVHDTPCMYLGYGETYSDAIAPADIKQEPVDMDEVW